MSFVEIITDATTGEVIVRELTAEEIAALEQKGLEALEAERAAMSLTFAQLLIGLVTEGWITEAEGEAWLTGTLPAQVTALVGTLPAEQQFAAKARAIRPSTILRLDPLVVMLGAGQNKSPEELDQFFRAYAGV